MDGLMAEFAVFVDRVICHVALLEYINSHHRLSLCKRLVRWVHGGLAPS